MRLDDVFPLVVYTNMLYRLDRNQQAIEEIIKLGITPFRVDGVVWKGTDDPRWNGWIGCGLCHLKCLKLAREQNKSIFIFEDDFLLINNYLEVISEALKELDNSFDMLYLGANVCSSIYQISSHIGKLTHAQATHAVGINKNFLDKLINHIEPRITTTIIDVMYANEVVPNNHCYITIPMVAIQRTDHSDIEGRKVDYSSWMEQRFQDQLVRMK